MEKLSQLRLVSLIDHVSNVSKTRKYISVRKFHELLAIVGIPVGRSTVYGWIQNGKIQSIQLLGDGGRIWIPVDEAKKISDDLYRLIINFEGCHGKR